MTTSPFNDDLIPRGEYCYDTRAASDPVTRETHLLMANHDTCPYWCVTAHGTVRCDRLGVEAVIESGDYNLNLALATAVLGAEVLARVRVSATFLTDQIKICAINVDVPGFDEPDGDDLLSWRT